MQKSTSPDGKDVKLVQEFFNTKTKDIQPLLILIDNPDQFKENLKSEIKKDFEAANKQSVEGHNLKKFIIDSLAAVAIGLVGYGAFRLYKMGFRKG